MAKPRPKVSRKNQLTLNKAPVTNNTPTMERLVVNFNGMVRHDSMEGRDYLVVPMIMMNEGVHAGSTGPLFYPKEELEKTPMVWNHKPIVVYHPQRNGVGVSACDPDVITNRKVGVIMNTHCEDGKLKAEAWLEESRMKLVDDRIPQFIENNTMMEVSTGVFTDHDGVSGEWNGEKFDSTASNYRPDHLALLPDQKGACSIEDGAGLLRLNHKGDSKELQKARKAYLEVYNRHAISHSQTFDLLWSALNDLPGMDDAFIDEVFDEFIIIVNDGSLFQRFYTIINDSQVEFVGDMIEVVRVTEFRTMDGSVVGNQKKETVMDKKAFIKALIQNSKWEEKDQEFLLSLSEDQLTKMGVEETQEDTPEGGDGTPADAAAAATPATPAAEGSTPAPATPAEAAPTGNEVTIEQYLANAPAGIQEVLHSGIQSHNRDKLAQIAVITANENNIFPKEALALKTLEELKGLAKLAAKAPAPLSPLALYAGLQETAQPDQNSNKEEAMVMPSMNFEKQA